MPPENNIEDQNVTWFSMVDEEPLSDDVDIDAYELEQPEVAFEDSIDAIQADALAPQDLLGFNDITRKQVHQLRAVWKSLPEEHRGTLAEVALMVAQDHAYADFGRFFQVLLEDVTEPVRLHAATGAGLSEIASLIKPLVDLAERDPGIDVREASLRALAPHVVGLDLGVVTDAQDEARLLKLKGWAQDAQWPQELRAAALHSYSYNTSDGDIRSIIESFVESGEDILQLGAMRAMIEFGAGQFTRFLEMQLRSQDIDAREAAALALGQSNDEAAVPMLTMTAREDMEPAVREAAYVALGNLGSRASLNALGQLRGHASDDEIDVIDASIQYATELQELENLDDLGMFEFEDDTEDEQ